LKVQIGIIDFVRFDRRQGLRQMRFVQTKRFKQQGSGRGQAFKGGFARNHDAIVEKEPQARLKHNDRPFKPEGSAVIFHPLKE
jgi:hypothetical protein